MREGRPRISWSLNPGYDRRPTIAMIRRLKSSTPNGRPRCRWPTRWSRFSLTGVAEPVCPGSTMMLGVLPIPAAVAYGVRL